MGPILEYKKYKVSKYDYAEGGVFNENSFQVYIEPVRIKFKRSNNKLDITISLWGVSKKKRKPMRVFRCKTITYFSIDNQGSSFSDSCIEKMAKSFGVPSALDHLSGLISQQTSIGTGEAIEINILHGLDQLIDAAQAQMSFVTVK